MHAPPQPPTHPLARELPLFGLSLHTPRLALRTVWDEDIVGLADAAAAGIHPSDEMPFVRPWSRDSRTGILRGTAANIASERASRTPERWQVSFAVRLLGGGNAREDAAWWEAPVIGRQDVLATDFPTLRSVETGSWLTASAQGHGLGAEMRHAVLLWAFDHLDATEATSGAYTWNVKSLGTSRSVGYEPNGTRRVVVEGRRQVEQHLRLTPSTHRRPDWDLVVGGDMEAVRADLGVPRSAHHPR